MKRKDGIYVENINIKTCSNKILKSLIQRAIKKEFLKGEKNQWVIPMKLYLELVFRLDNYKEEIYDKIVGDDKLREQLSQSMFGTKEPEEIKQIDKLDKTINLKAYMESDRKAVEYLKKEFGFDQLKNKDLRICLSDIRKLLQLKTNFYNKKRATEIYYNFLRRNPDQPELETTTISPEIIVYAQKRSKLRKAGSTEFLDSQIKEGLSGTITRDQIKQYYTEERNLSLTQEEQEMYLESQKNIYANTLWNKERVNSSENRIIRPPKFSFEHHKLNEKDEKKIEILDALRKDTSWLSKKQSRNKTNFGLSGAMLQVPIRDYYDLKSNVLVENKEPVLLLDAVLKENMTPLRADRVNIHAFIINNTDKKDILKYKEYCQFLWLVTDEEVEEKNYPKWLGLLRNRNKKIEKIRQAAVIENPKHLIDTLLIKW